MGIRPTYELVLGENKQKQKKIYFFFLQKKKYGKHWLKSAALKLGVTTKLLNFPVPVFGNGNGKYYV
jgi:hypothetical protein